MSKQDINNSRSQLPPYPPSTASAATLVENQNDRDHDAPQSTSQAPVEGVPEQARKPGGAPPPYVSQKLLGGWKLWVTVFV